MRIADDESHRHGFAERAAKAEHDAADYTDAGKRQHNIARHFPGGAAQPIGRFLQDRRHGLEHVARNRGDERQHHDGEDQTGRQHSDAIRRAGEQIGQKRYRAEKRNQQRLDMHLHERRKN